MCNCALCKHITHCIYLAFEDLKEATCMCHPSDVHCRYDLEVRMYS